MNFSTNSNIYTFNADSVLEAYAPFVEGDAEYLVVAISADDVSGKAREAVEKSVARLQLGVGACMWVRLESEAGALGAKDLFTLLEGLDPLCIIALDEQAAHKLFEAYRVNLPLERHIRIFGRNAVAFANFEKMLETEDGRQKAWAAMKTLVRQS